MKKTQRIIFKGDTAMVETKTVQQLSDCGYTFFIRVPRADHHVYKLHKIGGRFYWVAMWNSVEHKAGPDRDGFATIVDAIKHVTVGQIKVYKNNIDDIFNYHGLTEITMENV